VKVGPLLAHLQELDDAFAQRLRDAAERHRDDHDVYHQCHTFATSVDKRRQRLEPLAQRYGGSPAWSSAVGEAGGELLPELRTLYVAAQECAITWTMAAQAAKAARDQELLTVATDGQSQAEIQAKWFTTRIKTGAPQALVVGGPSRAGSAG
jgi:hypothetical protein